ncbi:hypothetical protein [Prauserella flavalba]|uniref:hypothetical protein n=1 Tax=Prauserella flavalba TaxID=1477506 RepID=UPI0011B7D0FA|nr:hypothetical protein [Prauserella flavalba]
MAPSLDWVTDGLGERGEAQVASASGRDARRATCAADAVHGGRLFRGLLVPGPVDLVVAVRIGSRCGREPIPQVAIGHRRYSHRSTRPDSFIAAAGKRIGDELQKVPPSVGGSPQT